jgi:RecA/RadA recombinase
MKESVSGAIVEGKTEIDKLRKRNEELEKSMRVLTESKNKSEVKLFLEARTSKYPETKKNFVKKALGDKSLQFIQENFDYTVRLFEKQEKKQLETIKEEAVQNRKHKPDFVKEQKIVTEKINTNTDEESDPYLDVLKKQTFRR